MRIASGISDGSRNGQRQEASGILGYVMLPSLWNRFGPGNVWLRSLGLLVVLGMVTMLSAADRYWVGRGGNNNWTTAANWASTSGGSDVVAVPGSTDQVYFDGAGGAGLGNKACTVNCASDAAGTVALWSQTSGYTVTVTFNTAYGGAFQTFTISGNATVNGGTWTHVANSTTQTNRLKVSIGGSLTLGASGSINVDGKGFTGSGTGRGLTSGTGAGHGGEGGTYDGLGGITYGEVALPITIGSNGAGGGEGGGAAHLTVGGASSLAGTISANATGSPWGAPSGGSIYLSTGTISGAGGMSVQGSAGGDGRGGGGGGRIAIVLTSGGADFTSHSGALNTVGGGGSRAASGTLYKQTNAQGVGHGTITIDNASFVTNPHVTTAIPAGLTWVDKSIVLQNAGTLAVRSGTTLDIRNDTITVAASSIVYFDGGSFLYDAPFSIAFNAYFSGTNAWTGNVTVANGGVMTHHTDNTAETYKLDLSLTGNLTVASGGSITAYNKGYESNTGPGKGVSVASSRAGGGHGGQGGNGTSKTYGNPTAPITYGSGGSGGGSGDGSGGGAIKLTVSGVTSVAGSILATGGGSGVWGPGAGGSLWLTTGTLSGAGTISCDGAAGSASGGGGGGGRLAVILTGGGADFTGYSGSLSAKGGLGSGIENGAAGTVYQQTTAQGANGGQLIVDNAGRTTTAAVTTLNDVNATSGLAENITVTVGSLSLANSGKFVVGASDQLTVGGTGTTVTQAAACTLQNDGTLSLGGTTFTLSGTTTLSTSGNTVIYTGQTSNAGVAMIPGPYHHLTLNKTGTTFTQSAAALTVAGNLTITAGTFASGAQNLNVAGNWANSGTYSGSNTVTLNGAGGTTQVISGTTTFNHLTATCATARTLNFTAGTTQTVSGTLTLTGASGQLLSLRSTSAPSTWSITPNGTRTCSYVNVMDGINTASPMINPANSTDSGNNTLWFPGSRYWVAGSPGNWSSTANWSASSGGAGGASVPISSDNVYFNASGIGGCTLDTAGTADSLTMVNGYSGTVAFGTNAITTVGTTDLRSGGSFTGTTGGLVMGATGTLTPPASGTIPNLTISVGTATLSTNALSVEANLTISSGTTLVANGQNINVAGNWANSGTFTAGAGTVTLNGADGSTQVISGSTTFNHLSATCAATRTIQFTTSTTQTVAGTLTLQGGAGQLILQRVGGAGQWSINPIAWAVDQVDVSDSVNLAATAIDPTNSFDLGNNVNWWTVGTVTLSTPVHCPAGDDIGTYGRTLNPRPALVWSVPSGRVGQKLHFVVTVDGGEVANSATSQTGFDYFDGTTWTAFPAAGVDPGTGTELARWRPSADLAVAAHLWTVGAVEAGGAYTGSVAQTRRFLIATRSWLAGLAARSAIRVGHVAELREEANYARNFRNLADTIWTDDPLVAWQTPIRKTHVDQLRTALSAAAVVSGSTATIGAETLTAGQTPIKADHLLELRTALGGL